MREFMQKVLRFRVRISDFLKKYFKIHLYLPKEIRHKQLFNEKTGKSYKGTINKQYVIVIDAGHQKHAMMDKEPVYPGAAIMKPKVASGTRGVVSGIAEHELNLDVALLLRDELLKDGYSVVMVRETADVEVSNIERAMIANRSKADVFMRIHANSYSDNKVHGAIMINPSLQSVTEYEYAQDRFLSEMILEEYCKATGIDHREIIECDDLTATNWSYVTTVLIELGFMSNEEDDLLMSTDEFKKNAARGIALGIEKYLKQK